ncbi:MAG: fused MFS/spermidine synthase [Chloroflexaceae bacterium]|nr:fused MFS/spermidine synthase [Chloroflexaceae bacterium]
MARLDKRPPFSSWKTLLYLLFLLSGFSGLVYQVVWVRQFGLVFGVTTYAVGTVLTAFFAGLALGSWLVARWLPRWKTAPLRLYGYLEIGIGLYALTIPLLLASLNGFYRVIFPMTGESFYLLSLIRFILSALILLIPTTCMGASLPLVVESLSGRVSHAALNVSTLYAINTLGAVVGAAFSGFYAFAFIGVTATMVIAVGANVVAGAGALVAARHFTTAAPPAPSTPTVSGGGSLEQPASVTTEDEDEDTSAPQPGRLLIPLGLFLSGFAALGYEVVWTRVVSMFMERTFVAFTAILCCVLVGIVIGSWLVRINAPLIRHPVRLLARLEMGVAWLNLLSPFYLAFLVPIHHQRNVTWLLLAIVLLVPNTLLGATLPLAVQVYKQYFHHLGQGVGEVYAANVLGGVVGSFTVSFLLLPFIGSQQTIVLLAVLNAGIAWLFYRAGPAPRRTVMVVGTGATALLALFFLVQPGFLFTHVNRELYRNQALLFQEEGLEGVVIVSEKPSPPVRRLYLNGTLESSSELNILSAHRRLAHLPLLLHPDPNDVLVVGLGAGTTSGAITRHEVETIKVVELSHELVRAAPFFARENYAVLDDPRVQIQVNDGRNYVLLTHQTFDVIESDVIFPYRAGSNNLYSADYYRLVASRLNPNGIVCQWLLNRPPEDDYKLLLRTFVRVFPNTTLWDEGAFAVAMPDGITIDADLIRQRFADPTLHAALQESGYPDADSFLRSFVMGPEDIQQYVGPGPILTDDHPYLEHTPRLRPGAIYLPRKDIRPFLKPVLTTE